MVLHLYQIKTARKYEREGESDETDCVYGLFFCMSICLSVCVCAYVREREREGRRRRRRQEKEISVDILWNKCAS